MAKDTKDKNGKYVKLIGPESRLSYPSLFQKRKFDDDSFEQFEATFIVPKNKKGIAALNAACKKAAMDKWGTTKGIKMPIMDGDEKGGENTEAYEGSYYFHARSQYAVAVVDKDKTPITEEDCYAGCYVRPSLLIKAGEYFDPKTKKLKSRYVSLKLRAVMKVKDGEPFASHGDAAEDFDNEGAEDPSNYEAGLDADDGGMDLSEFGVD